MNVIWDRGAMTGADMAYEQLSQDAPTLDDCACVRLSIIKSLLSMLLANVKLICKKPDPDERR